ncbi:MAG: hypothetical protein A2W22_02855 [Candidatus Levybacteria bacterium RBG_16_35_11]|nr:MAG: hypothetical protein A2W22_02855 [Candidatus Levybacteria bacterium RBG_16_35_11]
MKFNLRQEDPLNILSSTRSVVENLRHLKIHPDKIQKVSSIVENKLEKGLDMVETHFGKADNLSETMQLIFMEDSVNFCFWAEKDKPKWKVEFPEGNISTGGWYGLSICFQRALKEKIPILDVDYLINLNLTRIRHLFRGINGVEIPLIQKRMDNLKQAGEILKKKYNSQFINVVEHAKYNAINLVRLLVRDFPSFKDIARWNGRKIYFLKRAQICAQDISYIKEKDDNFSLRKVNLLSAFADYKIPQMLRKYEVISYNKKLAEKVDNYVLIPAGSEEEIEIRSATIWCIELIRKRIKKYTAGDIDNALWLISQEQKNIKPYHRTYTIFY